MAGRHLSLFLRKSAIMVINVLHLSNKGVFFHTGGAHSRCKKVQIITALQDSCANNSGNDGILGTIILCLSVNGANRDCSITKAYWSFHHCSRILREGRSPRLSSLEMSFVAPSSLRSVEWWKCRPRLPPCFALNSSCCTTWQNCVSLIRRIENNCCKSYNWRHVWDGADMATRNAWFCPNIFIDLIIRSNQYSQTWTRQPCTTSAPIPWTPDGRTRPLCKSGRASGRARTRELRHCHGGKGVRRQRHRQKSAVADLRIA